MCNASVPSASHSHGVSVDRSPWRHDLIQLCIIIFHFCSKRLQLLLRWCYTGIGSMVSPAIYVLARIHYSSAHSRRIHFDSFFTRISHIDSLAMMHGDVMQRCTNSFFLLFFLSHKCRHKSKLWTQCSHYEWWWKEICREWERERK